MPSAEEIRTGQRETWDKFSGGWDKWDDLVMQWLAAAGDEIVRSLDVAEDQHDLDIASGTGEPGFTIARLAPKGRVVLTDISPKMLAAAKRRADEQGLDNVEIKECSADQLPFDDGTFDSVSCRFGFMFFPDVQTAANEMVRVLKPGGKLATAVWAQPEGNAWMTLPMSVIAGEVDMPAPDPKGPGMFRCATPGMMADVFTAAGLHDVRETDVTFTMGISSPEEYWHLLTEVAAPVVGALSQVDDATRDRIAAKVIEGAGGYTKDGQTQMPGHARCIVGTK